MNIPYVWIEGFATDGPALFVVLFVLGVLHVFVPPIPLEAISLYTAYLSGAGHGSPLIAWIGPSLGVAVGSIGLFALARSRGEAVLRARFVRKQLTPEGLEKARGWFSRFGVWAIFAGKCIPGMSLVTVLCSAFFGMGPRVVLGAVFAANGLFFGAVVASGRLAGQERSVLVGTVERVSSWLGAAAILSGALLCATVCVIRLRRR